MLVKASSKQGPSASSKTQPDGVSLQTLQVPFGQQRRPELPDTPKFRIGTIAMLIGFPNLVDTQLSPRVLDIQQY